MMPGPIPHERIRRVGDRSWTFRLLDVLRSPAASKDERIAAVGTLNVVSDYRAVEPLIAMLEDASLTETTRWNASAVLQSIDDCTTAEQRRRWWESGDPSLMEHALGLMGRSEAEIVLAVATDDEHPLQYEALDTLSFGFGEASFVPILVRALKHDDEDVRERAAKSLFWFDAVEAGEALIEAAGDRDEDFAVRAIECLGYLASRRTLRALHDLKQSLPGRAGEQAESAYEQLLGMFEWSEPGGNDPSFETDLLLKWIEPVADLVDWPTEPDEDDADPWSPPPTRDPLSVRELTAILAKADGEWETVRDALDPRRDWSQYSSDERASITGQLLAHPDPDVRDRAPSLFTTWSNAEALKVLAGDPSATVRKAAIYGLGELATEESLAPFAWATLEQATGTSAYEALHTYVVHAPPGQAAPRLESLVRDDPRVEVRVHGVLELMALRAVDQLERLMPVLDEPPCIHWGLHRTLLNAINELGLPAPNLDRLASVDDLHLHLEVVGLLSRRP
jgi:HEAT repeat protein